MRCSTVQESEPSQKKMKTEKENEEEGREERRAEKEGIDVKVDGMEEVTEKVAAPPEVSVCSSSL